MWLPKDERKTLLKYYHYLKNAQDSKSFVQLSQRARNATLNLTKRSLVHEIVEGGSEHKEYLVTCLAEDAISLSGFLSGSEEDRSARGIILRLTLDGLDLGRKYNRLFDRIGLWCAAKEHQWLWYIIAFVAGGLVLRLCETILTIFKKQ